MQKGRSFSGRDAATAGAESQGRSAWRPRFVRTNGIDMATYEAGSGPPVVLLHGFPELAYSWRHQIRALAQNNWHAVAPDLRGFGATGPKGDVSCYRFSSLAEDVLGMIEALSLRRPVLIGHDFGGALAWSIARDHPETISGIISLCTPYTRHGPDDLICSMRKYKGEQNYMVRFQEPGVAETLLEADIVATFKNMMRRSPLSLEEFQSDASLQVLPMSLFFGEPAVMGEPLMPSEELAVFIEAYQRTGFTGALNWYRALPLTWQDAAARPDRVDVPALIICADADYFLPPSTTRGMEAFVPDLERGLISPCGHWMQHDQPDATNRLILDWLERRMRNRF